MDIDQNVIEKILLNADLLQLIVLIIASSIIFAITTSVKLWIQNYLAYKSIIGSLLISNYTVIRFYFNFGTIDGRIKSIDKNRIEIETEDTIVVIPTIEFEKSTWNILKQYDENVNQLKSTELINL